MTRGGARAGRRPCRFGSYRRSRLRFRHRRRGIRRPSGRLPWRHLRRRRRQRRRRRPCRRPCLRRRRPSRRPCLCRRRPCRRPCLRRRRQRRRSRPLRRRSRPLRRHPRSRRRRRPRRLRHRRPRTHRCSLHLGGRRACSWKGRVPARFRCLRPRLPERGWSCPGHRSTVRAAGAGRARSCRGRLAAARSDRARPPFRRTPIGVVLPGVDEGSGDSRGRGDGHGRGGGRWSLGVTVMVDGEPAARGDRSSDDGDGRLDADRAAQSGEETGRPDQRSGDRNSGSRCTRWQRRLRRSRGGSCGGGRTRRGCGRLSKLRPRRRLQAWRRGELGEQDRQPQG